MQEASEKLEMFLSEIKKTGASESAGSVHSVTVRLPSGDFSSIEGLTRYSGMARNKVIVNLLQIGLERVLNGLDQETKTSIFDHVVNVFHDLHHDEKGNLTKILEQSKKGEI